MLRSALLALSLACASTPALAGPLDGWFGSSRQDGVTLAQGQGTVADLVARVQRLEGQNRQLTGQVQEMQNMLRRTLDDFQRYREDTEYRLQTLEGGKPPAPQKRSQADQGARQASAAPQDAGGPGAPPTTLGTVPGAPAEQEIVGDGGEVVGTGTVDAGGQYALDQGDAMQLPRYEEPPSATQPPPSGLTPPGLPGIAAGQGTQAQPQMAALPATPEEEYTTNYRLIEGKQYEAAELAFRKFVKDHPNDKRVPDSIHFVGESLYQRQQYRDAAEQFLTVTTKYGNYRRAPSSMLRLGMSLAALGEKEAACATFQEIAKKYPSASAAVKSGAERETQKNGC
jgi:tol-pal system protein YbgF